MPDEGMIGYGTTLHYDADGGPTYVALGKITNIGGPGRTVGATSFLCMDSVGAIMEKLAQGIELGQVSIDFAYEGTAAGSYALLDALLRTVKDWKITWPDGAVVPFSGFLAGLEPTTPADTEIACSATIEVTEIGTFTPAA